MPIIFEIEDKFHKRIYLSKERWNHIITEHPEISNKVSLIQEILTKPLIVKESEYDSKVKWFYLYEKNRNSPAKYLFVSVKYLNGEGFIITIFYTAKIRG